MATFPTPTNLVINNFKGIRSRNVSVGSDGYVSAEKAVNVELVPADDGSGVDLRTTLGNVVYFNLEEHITELGLTKPKIIEIFESEQDGIKHLLLYVVDSVLDGCLIRYSPSLNELALEKSNMAATSEANGITMSSTAYDVFAFTNGEEYYSYCYARETRTIKLNPKYENVAVKGLPLAEYRGSLVIGCENGVVLASRQGDIEDWEYTDIDQTKAWYQLFYKKITAVVPYIDGLLVFTNDSSTMLSGNLSYATEAERSSASIGGCLNHKSWVIHDKYLFFYDNNQKNIYYYIQNDIGEKVVGKPVGDEIQYLLTDVKDMSFVSYIGNNKSEIWLRFCDDDDNTTVLIFNYTEGEFTERKMNFIKGLTSYNYKVLTFDNTKVFEERAKTAFNCIFNGKFIGALYRTPYMSLGSYNNLKEQDIKPLLSYGKYYNNTFSTNFFNNKKVKYKRFRTEDGLDFVFGDDTDLTPQRTMWDVAIFPEEDKKAIGTVKAKAPSSYYYIGFEIFTEETGDDFCIKQIELKEITQETDTTGAR